MKKIARNTVLLAMAFIMLFIITPQPVRANDTINVTVDGQIVQFETAPFIRYGTTLVPLGAIANTLGINATWCGDTRTITYTNPAGTTFVLTVDYYYVQYGIGQRTRLDAPPMIVYDRTFVPLRFVGESLGLDVYWIGATRTAQLTSMATTQVEQPTPTPTPLPFGLTEATVTRVIDGDTIELSTGERVRLIGVDAPEIGTPGADEATAFVTTHILNQTVWLEADGNNTDVHGRLRRYVWLQIPTDNTSEVQIRAYQLNAMLLENGLAEVLIVGNVRNADLFRYIAQPLPAVQEAPQPTPTPSGQASVDMSRTVWLARTGNNIYHSVNNCGNMNPNTARSRTRQQARDMGARACQRCW